MTDYHELMGERVKVMDKDGYYESVPIPDIVSCEVLDNAH